MSNQRLQAAKVIMAVVDQQRSLDVELQQARDSLEPAQGAWLQAVSYGSLRYYGVLEKRLASLLRKPIRRKERLIHHLLISAIYQLDVMGNASHAVVNETVNCVAQGKLRWARGLVNGTLRELLRQQGSAESVLALDDAQASLPAWLAEQIKTDWPQQSASLFKALAQQPPMYLRVSPESGVADARAAYLTKLADVEITASAVDGVDSAIQVTPAVDVMRLPDFTSGAVAVQDIAAQLAAPLLQPASASRVLDACAAPGGKAVHLAQLMANPEALFAVDLEPRMARLQANVARHGLACELVTGDWLEQPKLLASKSFERIMLDAPCSGSGVMGRHPDIPFRREPTDIAKFQQQQRALLERLWPLLEDDGLLLYVTCSVLKAENDGVIGDFIQDTAQAQLVALPDSLGIASEFGRQRLPGVHAGDGFYYALLRKSA